MTNDTHTHTHTHTQQDVSQAVYESYEEALALCQNDAYEGQDLVDVVVRKNLRLRERLSTNATLDLGAARSLIAFSFASPERYRILDFGGGGGNHYSIARLASPKESKLLWSVVETPTLCRAARCLENDELSFFDSVDEATAHLKTVDIVFTSGALQCCGNPMHYLEKLLQIRAKRVFITRTAFNQEDECLVTIQKSRLSHNGPGDLPDGFIDRDVFYPNVFVPLSSVQKLILDNGYQIRYLMVEEQGYAVRGKPVYMFGVLAELG